MPANLQGTLPSSTKRVYEATYGTYEIAWGGYTESRRVDRYIPKDGSRATIERPMFLDTNDVSPIVNTYAAQHGIKGDHVRPYSARCACCYLRIPHTVALHDSRANVTPLWEDP